jgi:hypothetical protein
MQGIGIASIVVESLKNERCRLGDVLQALSGRAKTEAFE